MTRTPTMISEVVKSSLCTGCGGCAGMFPDAIRMGDDRVNGRRPVVAVPGGDADRAAMAVCAGVEGADWSARDPVEEDWGPVEACWEGYAADPEIRHRGSSGGAATALALFALHQNSAQAVAHIRGRAGDARFNETILSEDRASLLSGAGSRYAQASPLEILSEIRAQKNKVAVIGKPCDIAGLQKARAADAALEARIDVSIAIFCAGAPTLEGTEKLLARLGVPAETPVTQLRYRGDGWPGLMQARWQEGKDEKVSTGIPYAEGWGEILQAHRRWRCRVCDDHTGAAADISVGDPWHNPPKDAEEAGRSLIVARTARGRALIEAAIAAGVLVAETRSRDIIAAAQPNLLSTNAHVWGRRAAMRLTGLPVPRATSASRFGVWLRRLSLMDKARSILGTLRRIRRNRVTRPVVLAPLRDPFANR